MNKFLLIFLLLPTLGWAQFKPGEIFLGGTANLELQSAPESNSGPASETSNYGISPLAGIFISERYAVGLTGGFDNVDETVSSVLGGSLNTKSESYSVGAFGRWYVPISQTFFFTLGTSVLYSNGTTKQSASAGSTVEFKNTAFSVNCIPLFTFFPSPHWGFEAGVGQLSYIKRQDADGDRKSGIALNLGSVSLGINYYFRKE